MIEALFQNLSLSNIHRDLMRNIVSLRVSEHLFDDLSDDQNDWQTAIALEMDAKPATFTNYQPIINRPFEEAEWDNAIGYPFTHWQQSRYSDGSFGIWYGADGIETTIHETVYHWHNGLLADAGFLQPNIKIQRRVYNVRCDAALINLATQLDQYPSLVSPHDYSFCQQVGARLHREGHPGLISLSARCAGQVFAVLNANLLSNPRHHCYLTYTTTADGISVEQTPGEILMAIPSPA